MTADVAKPNRTPDPETSHCFQWNGRVKPPRRVRAWRRAPPLRMNPWKGPLTLPCKNSSSTVSVLLSKIPQKTEKKQKTKNFLPKFSLSLSVFLVQLLYNQETHRFDSEPLIKHRAPIATSIVIYRFPEGLKKALCFFCFSLFFFFFQFSLCVWFDHGR